MTDIHHQVRMNAPLDEVFRALETRELFGAFAGAEAAKVALQTVSLEDGARLSWRCVDGPSEWIGTNITFDLRRDGTATVLRFRHHDWREATETLARCSTQWGRLLLSLKNRLETPEAEDLYL